MERQLKYSIGDVSQLCNISKKALRYYDKIGLICPKRQDYNNYRYYTHESLLAVPVIKYYKQMGFTLDEMRSFIEGNIPSVYRTIRNSFRAKMQELENSLEELRRKHVAVKDWYELILEAEAVIDNNTHEVSIKYIKPAHYLFLDQSYDANIKALIINIDFTNYVESLGNEITGPVILEFSSFKDRMEDRAQQVKLMQKTLIPCPKNLTTSLGGQMMAACYHTGPHETIGKTYKKIHTWAKQHRYVLGKASYERYVTDYWTTRNSAKFVTEVMVAVSR